jgi:peroxiredoxin Q/BCP
MVTSGQKASSFTLPDQEGNKVSLQDFRGKKLILYFYLKDNTPGCTIIYYNYYQKESLWDH